ncbi:SMP-30/gluconolactonase/LRE family protein [Starkeya sp. ORNL1]|uniref:SMP-30/gluconolactonase/LRE family protein n=1 Tax=Starkeya sp. ORNL1 TaxID=2709380 RepID=UPI0014631C9D|nr:SMP-30/gluconolactonase/LRE family protein [Starkeya sp. ORNL1]QJP13063.1 SMP-30/gluconolactonase/LRE family protein [Starkeya sp. ORNL1]
MSWQFERVAGPFEGEAGGLVWDGAAMLFTTVDEHRLLRFDPKTGATEEARRYTNRAKGLAYGPNGELYAAQEGGRRIIQLMADGSVTALKALLDGKYHNNPCALTVDAAGRVWFCDPFHPIRVFGPALFPPLPHGSILRLHRDDRRNWALRRITFDTVSPRTLALSADEKTLFVADGEPSSPGDRELRAYPVRPDGSVGTPRVLHAFGRDGQGAHRGIEGMCLDAEGNIVAVAGSRAAGPGPLVYVFTPEGRILATHSLPGDLPAACAFGGDGLEDLYVTTAQGELYRARTDRRGAAKTGAN